MIRTIRMAATAVAALAFAAVPAAAIASVAHPRPHFQPQAVTFSVTTQLRDRGDSGGAGDNWATDTISRHFAGRCVQLTFNGSWTCTATLADTGSFTTIPLALAPNQGPGHAGQREALRPSGGTLRGGGTFHFSASRAPSLPAELRMDLYAQYGGANSTSTWDTQLFAPGTTVTGGLDSDWGWDYATAPHLVVTPLPGGGYFISSAPSEHWADTAVNGGGQLPADGQITG